MSQDDNQTARGLRLPAALQRLVTRDELPASQRADALLDRPADVAALNPVELHDLIHDVGLADASELALLATPEQLQIFSDLDAWRKDRFDLAGFEPWVEVALGMTDAAFESLYRELDSELLPLFLQSLVTVHQVEEDVVPEVPPDDPRPLELSPDGGYWLQYPLDEVQGELTRRLVRKAYDALGVTPAWALLEATRWELRSDLEERAYRLRKGRLEDFGFVLFEDAATIYAAVEPAEVRREAGALADHAEQPYFGGASPVSWGDGPDAPWPDMRLRVPSEALRPASAGADASSFLDVCLQRLSEDTWVLVEPQLVALVNRVAAADLAEPGDRSTLGPALERTVDTLNLGLEFVAGNDPERGTFLLEAMPLRRLFQAGHGLVLKLQRQARELVARGNLTVTDAPASLVEPADRDLVEGLLRARPLRSVITLEPFRSHAQIEAAAVALAGVAARELIFFGMLRFGRDELVAAAYHDGLAVGPAGVTFANLFATMVLRAHLDGAPALAPFVARDVPRTEATIRAAFAPWEALDFLPPGADAVLRAATRRFVARVEQAVLDELATGLSPLDPRFLDSVLILLPAKAAASAKAVPRD